MAKPITPMIIRIAPTNWMSMPSRVAVTAKCRIAPTATRQGCLQSSSRYTAAVSRNMGDARRGLELVAALGLRTRRIGEIALGDRLIGMSDGDESGHAASVVGCAPESA